MSKYILYTLFALSSSIQAQAFGQNKVQYRDFEWNYIANPDYNFAVYYYGDQIELATYTMEESINCLLYTSPSPRDLSTSRMPSSA